MFELSTVIGACRCRGIRTDIAIALVSGDMVLTTKGRYGNITLVRLPILVHLRFRELHRPARIFVFLAKLRWLILPSLAVSCQP